MRKRKRSGPREDETGIVVLPPADAEEDMGIVELLANIGNSAEGGNLNLIAQDYVRFSKERENSVEHQQIFETNLKRALDVCMEGNRIAPITEFLANSSIPIKIKQGANRFMLGVVTQYAEKKDFDALIELLRNCSLPEAAKKKAQEAIGAIERQRGKAFLQIDETGKRNRRMGKPTFMSAPKEAPKKPSRLPLPPNHRSTSDVPTGEVRPSRLPPLKK